MVGQNYLRLLVNHPWFEIIDVAASSHSAGLEYKQAVAGKWYMPSGIPAQVADLIVRDVADMAAVASSTRLIFSALELPEKADTRALEFQYAKAGFPLVSNSSANRWTPDVPIIIPEINPEHVAIIPVQQANHKLPKTGFIVVKPNCSIQSYLVTLVALEAAGYPVDRVQVTTLQALSGAGRRGLSDPEMRNNVIPNIPGEEEKTEREPLKVLGAVSDTGILNTDRITIDATCTRVPVDDGHTAVVRIGFKNNEPTHEDIKRIWRDFSGESQKLKLPSAPPQPIIYLEEDDRPQPRLDRDAGQGMAITVGRLAEDKFLDAKYVALSHNTIRGAAGGATLAAELLVAKGLINGH